METLTASEPVTELTGHPVCLGYHAPHVVMGAVRITRAASVTASPSPATSASMVELHQQVVGAAPNAGARSP